MSHLLTTSFLSIFIVLNIFLSHTFTKFQDKSGIRKSNEKIYDGFFFNLAKIRQLYTTT